MNSVNQSNFSPRKSKRKNENDLEKCCVCFAEEHLYNINTQLDDCDTSLLGALIFCLPDESFSEKWTPPNMCPNCLNGLSYTYTFLKQVSSTQSILRKTALKTKEKHSDLIDRIEVQRRPIKYHRVFLKKHLLNNTKDNTSVINDSQNEITVNTDHDYPKTSDVKDERGEKVQTVKKQKFVKIFRKVGRKRRKLNVKKTDIDKGSEEEESAINIDNYEESTINIENDEESFISIINDVENIAKIENIKTPTDELIAMNEDNEQNSMNIENDELQENTLIDEIEEDESLITDNKVEMLNNENNTEENPNKNNEQKVFIQICDDINKTDGSKTLLIIYNDKKPPLQLKLRNTIDSEKDTSKPEDSNENEFMEGSEEVDVGAYLDVNIDNESQDKKKTPNIRKSRLKNIKCNGCGIKFNQTRLYLKHMKTKHSLDNNVLCDICGKLCVNKAVLLKHKLSHSDERPFKCEVCLKNFKSSRQLNIHNKRNHPIEENLNVFVCTVCSKKFTKVFELRNHLYSHTNQIPYACKICEKKFALKDNLRNYKLEEDRNRPFTCDLCEQNDLVPNYADEVYINSFNVPKHIVENLSDRFKSSKYFHGHFGQYGGIPAINQVLIFLWYIGNKTQNYRIVAEKFNITISSLNRVIQRITTFLSGLSSEIICWPTEEEKIEIESNFRKMSFPNVIGSIETFCIRMDKPRNEATKYINTKGEHSIKIQIVSDHRAKILDVFIGCPGSVPDSEVFNISSIGRNLNEMCGNYFLLGDKQYTLRRNLITPYEDASLLSCQRNFNERLFASQHIVKLCFDLLTKKFPQVSHIKLKDIELIVHFVRAVCVLHNLTIDYENGIEQNIHFMKFESCDVPIEIEGEEEDVNLIRDAVAEWLEDLN